MKNIKEEERVILEQASEILNVKLKHLLDYAEDYNTIYEEIASAESEIDKIIVKGKSSLIRFKDGSFTIED